PNKALTFATGWIARNIETGPFSRNDPPIYDGPIAMFRRNAAQAGFGEADLEHGIGAVPAFIAKAYADSAAKWRADLSLPENTEVRPT
ncbi:MAG: hypothetical protein ABI395_10775, partial [Sphingobium sp.]